MSGDVSSNNKSGIPLFLLGAVLFPGAYLPLRVFEPRYTDMISRCMKQERNFGVCLIQEGQETGEAAVPYKIGTTAKIVDWDTSYDGLLSVTVLGEERFRVLDNTVQADNLVTAEYEIIEGLAESALYPAHDTEEEKCTWGKLYQVLKNYLESVQDDKTRSHEISDDPQWVSYRLAELLTIPLPAKQELLELDSVTERIMRIAIWAKELKWI